VAGLRQHALSVLLNQMEMGSEKNLTLTLMTRRIDVDPPPRFLADH